MAASGAPWRWERASAPPRPSATQGTSQFAVVVSILLGAGWAWAGLAVAAGWLAGAPARGGARRESWLCSRPRRRTTRWTRCSATSRSACTSRSCTAGGSQAWCCGPLLGAVGAYVERPGARGLLAALAVPAGALAQMVVHPPGAGNLIVTPETRLAQAIVLVAGGAVASRRPRPLPRRATSLEDSPPTARVCRSRKGSSLGPPGLMP